MGLTTDSESKQMFVILVVALILNLTIIQLMRD